MPQRADKERVPAPIGSMDSATSGPATAEDATQRAGAAASEERVRIQRRLDDYLAKMKDYTALPFEADAYAAGTHADDEYGSALYASENSRSK